MTCPSCQFRFIFNMNCLTCQAKHINMIPKEDAKAWLRKLRNAEGEAAMNAVIAEAERLRGKHD